jgi:hypothetical protein
LQGAGQRPGADFGFLGALLDAYELALVLAPLTGVEHRRSNDCRFSRDVVLKD